MEIIFFVVGILIGILITIKLNKRERIHGIIYVDHKTEQCKFQITSDELSNRNKKIAVFYIDHNATISQE